jgi:hypothetical protein
MRDWIWEHRCEQWGAWRVGAQGVPVATWQRMADGLPLRSGGGAPLPKLNLAALEMHELIGHLPVAQQQLLWRFYPRTGKLVDVARSLGITPETLRNRVDATHRALRRLSDQRRRGEEMDVDRRRPHGRVRRATVQADGRRMRVAAVIVDEN